MPEQSDVEQGKARLEGCIYTLENLSFHAGDSELHNTLFWLSRNLKPYMDATIAERIKAALRLPVYREKEVIQMFKDYRRDFPKEDWWWWPERL